MQTFTGQILQKSNDFKHTLEQNTLNQSRFLLGEVKFFQKAWCAVLPCRSRWWQRCPGAGSSTGCWRWTMPGRLEPHHEFDLLPWCLDVSAVLRTQRTRQVSLRWSVCGGWGANGFYMAWEGLVWEEGPGEGWLRLTNQGCSPHCLGLWCSGFPVLLDWRRWRKKGVVEGGGEEEGASHYSASYGCKSLYPWVTDVALDTWWDMLLLMYCTGHCCNQGTIVRL